MRKIGDDHLGPRIDVLAGIRDVLEVFLGIAHIECDDISGRQDHGVDVDGEIGRGHNRRITRSHQGQAHVAEALLGSNGGDDLRIGIETHTVPLVVAQRDFLAEIRDARRNRVAVVLGILQGIRQLFTDHRIWRIGGISHPQVDDVDAGHPLLILQLVDLAEEVGRQPPHAARHRDGKRIVRLGCLGFAAHGRRWTTGLKKAAGAIGSLIVP